MSGLEFFHPKSFWWRVLFASEASNKVFGIRTKSSKQYGVISLKNYWYCTDIPWVYFQTDGEMLNAFFMNCYRGISITQNFEFSDGFLFG